MPKLGRDIAIKPQSGILQMTESIDSENYDGDMGQTYGQAVNYNLQQSSDAQRPMMNKIDASKQNELSGISLYGDRLMDGRNNTGQYAVGVLRNGELEVHVLDAVISARPDLSHIDLLKAATKDQQKEMATSTDESDYEDKKDLKSGQKSNEGNNGNNINSKNGKSPSAVVIKKADDAADHNQALSSRLQHKRAVEDEEWIFCQRQIGDPSLL
ncbi:hypothetical protein MIR68_011750 [Amoeboaphelidium protococcarum]|nr:hypothetical protein MIR68_011750 [Amoeboaphelidium protococcarum]